MSALVERRERTRMLRGALIVELQALTAAIVGDTLRPWQLERLVDRLRPELNLLHQSRAHRRAER